jgi:hypothetical protein
MDGTALSTMYLYAHTTQHIVMNLIPCMAWSVSSLLLVLSSFLPLLYTENAVSNSFLVPVI